MIGAFARLDVIGREPEQGRHHNYPPPDRRAALEGLGDAERPNLDYRQTSIDLNATYAPLGDARQGCSQAHQPNRQNGVTAHGEKQDDAERSSAAFRLLSLEAEE